MESTIQYPATDNAGQMNDALNDYRCEIVTSAAPREAFAKIARVSEWWAKHFEGSAGELNDTFTIRWGETFVTFLVTECEPQVRAEWTVTDCFLPWLSDKQEWTGTKAVWQISQSDGSTRISFAHIGLVSGIECYESCVKGWDQYVKGSLLAFLNDGTGSPG